MGQIEQKSIDVNGVKIAYTVIGTGGAKPVFFVHGLLSNGRDYDALGLALAGKGYKCICIDLPGRGKSDWLPEAKLYQLPTYFPYCADVIQKEIGAQSFDWFGVSLGGLLGMMMATGTAVNIDRLILGDIGAEVPSKGLKKVSEIAKEPCRFSSFFEAVSFLKKRCGAWDIKQDATWNHLIAHNIVHEGGDIYRMHYDPAIGAVIPKWMWTVKLWKAWDLIKQPVILIRGADSVLMTPKIAAKMQKRYKGVSFTDVSFENCGHVPNMMEKPQIQKVLSYF